MPDSKPGEEIPAIELNASNLTIADHDEIPLQPKDDEYPSGFRLYIVFLALALSVLIVGLDASIVATAAPRITDSFNSLGDVGCLLTACTCQLAYGRMYQIFAIKWVFMSAIIIFEIGSLIAALAPASSVLIFGRAVSGLGFAGIGTGSLIIVAHSVAMRQRALFTGIIGAMEGIGFIMGPLVGGVLTSRASWQWCFWINLPVGAITAAVVGIFLKPPRLQTGPKRSLQQKMRQFDWFGTLAFVPSILCLLLALQWGGSKFAWGNARIIVLFILFGALLVGFALIQRYSQKTATIPRRVAKSRSMVFGALFAFSLSAALSILSYFLPLWFQGIKNASALKSGVMLLPVILGMIVGSVLGGSVVTVIGYYQPLMVLSGVITPVGAGLLTTFSVNTPHSHWIGYSALAGIGAGLGFQQPMLAAQVVLEKDDVPVGTSIMIFSQSLAGAVSISVGSTIFSNRLLAALKSEVPQIDPSLVLGLGATNLRTAIPAPLLDAVLVAYNQAITETFYAAAATSGLAFFLAFGMELRSVKKKQS
ncbi:hypothetical protein MMC22_001189 [Lobaria immixta]|nr:hypothetical protein [Lobaria immixta]